MIRLKSLHKFFNKGKQNEIHVLNDLDLEMPASGMVAIFGKSGCGKTTLLNVIGGLDRFGEGSVTIDGQDIRRDTDVIRNRYMGYVFQNYNLNKNESCFENVAAALRLCGMKNESEIEARVKAALFNVGMDKFSSRTPDTLSGGQQQRIAIARAIVKNPRIILADEPTGNLDEANTVMIMDLLKQIAQDHLVLLVTHEANLVEYYCDTVVELSDGRVVSVRKNHSANGFLAKSKNDVYLGELEKRELHAPEAELAYYGAAPIAPIKLRLVHHEGKLYLSVDSPEVHILDESSEIKLREGVYKQADPAATRSACIDMSALPPIEGNHFGKLFGFSSSVKSGYQANFKTKKRGGKLLRRCMCLFAAVVVMMSAIFGTSIGSLLDVQNSYNHNVFYLYTPDGAVSEKLSEAMQAGEGGIDYLRLYYGYPAGDDSVAFMTGFFESFQSTPYDSGFQTNAVYLDLSHGAALPLVEGKKDDLEDHEIVITTCVADALLEKSSLGYIKEYRDLLGLINPHQAVNGKNLCITGIVRSDEPTIYTTELCMARRTHQNSGLMIGLASDRGMTVKEGEALLLLRNDSGTVTYPTVGEAFPINGRALTLSRVINHFTDYISWLDGNGIKKADQESYYWERIQKEHPSVERYSEVYYELLSTLQNEAYLDYFDYYYDQLDEFYTSYAAIQTNDIYGWLYLYKGIEEAKYSLIDETYYKAKCFEELYGRAPSYEELMQAFDKLPFLHDQLSDYLKLYEEEFYQNGYTGNSRAAEYLLSEADYIAIARQIGETHATAGNLGEVSYGYEIEYEKQASVERGIAMDFDVVSLGSTCYTLIHSSDPKVTVEYLAQHFGDLDTGVAYAPALLTPNDIFERLIDREAESIVISLITMAVILAVMSLCMYFIMRSSLMNRIKEVGIYRAIGVSRRNMLFKFFTESLVLTALTVFIGYLGTSIFLWACLGFSALVDQLFFYPIWMALADLLVLFALCVLFGTLPIISLLRKTPSEILAKYDI